MTVALDVRVDFRRMFVDAVEGSLDNLSFSEELLNIACHPNINISGRFTSRSSDLIPAGSSRKKFFQNSTILY